MTDSRWPSGAHCGNGLRGITKRVRWQDESSKGHRPVTTPPHLAYKSRMKERLVRLPGRDDDSVVAPRTGLYVELAYQREDANGRVVHALSARSHRATRRRDSEGDPGRHNTNGARLSVKRHRRAARDNPGTTLSGLTQSREGIRPRRPPLVARRGRRLHPDVLLYAPSRSRTRRRKKGEGSQRQ